MRAFKILILVIALFLSACATPIPAAEMMPNPNIYNQLDTGKLTKNVSVGKVQMSDDMPKSGLVVTEEEFRLTLTNALQNAKWQNSTNAKYTLNATFVKFEQPFTLFNTKIFSVVNYELVDTKNGTVPYKQTVKIPCVKGMGEYFDGNIRQVQTMLCSIRENVTHVFRDLNSKF